jgi:hypothetical protein
MDVVDYISAERLKTYEIHTDRQEKAIALHNHTLQLGSSLMSMIALLELSLRNSTNLRLIESFGDDQWMVSGKLSVPLRAFERNTVKTAVKQAQKASYSKLSYRDKAKLDLIAFPSGKPKNISHKNEVLKRRETFSISHGQAISETTFSFWKRLYSSEYEGTLWKTSLKRVFPNKKLKRSDISKPLESVYATRNRVAHHEPVYGERLAEAIDALEFLRNSMGARSGDDETTFKKFSRIQYLRLRMDHESFLEAWSTLT